MYSALVVPDIVPLSDAKPLPGGRESIGFLIRTFFLFTVLTAVMTYPQMRHLRDAVHDPGDPLLNLWALSWVAHQLPLAPAHLFDGNIFAPERWTLAYSETLLAPVRRRRSPPVDGREPDSRLQHRVSLGVHSLGRRHRAPGAGFDTEQRRGARGGRHLRVSAVPVRSLPAAAAAAGPVDPAGALGLSPRDEQRPTARRAMARGLRRRSGPLVHVLRRLPRQLPRGRRRRADVVALAGGADQTGGPRRRGRAGGRRAGAGGQSLPRCTRGGRRARRGRERLLERQVAQLPRHAGQQQDLRMVGRALRRARAEVVPRTGRRDARRGGPVAALVGGASGVRPRPRVCGEPHARLQRPAVPIPVRACGAIPRAAHPGVGGHPGRILARRARRLRHRAGDRADEISVTHVHCWRWSAAPPPWPRGARPRCT